jgi:glutamate-ammonia-ligase adenylyltransferase
MALTRARVIAGPERLKTVLRRDISGILDRPARDPATGQPMTAERIRVDVVEMRRRLARDLPASGPWDIKRRDGGLMEVEFIAQALQLIACDAKARSPETRVAFSRLAKTAQIAPADARFLIKADETWRSLQSLLRILCGRKPPESLMDSMPVTTRELLIGDMQALSQEDLLGKMDALSGDVRKMFEKIIGKI